MSNFSDPEDVVIQIRPSKSFNNGPYQAYVASLLATHPHLQVLEQFMNEKDWELWKEYGFPKEQGLNKFSVFVVDIETTQKSFSSASLRVSPLLDSSDSMAQYLDGHRLTASGSLRLFLIEGLSRDLIEYFGSKFRLDPNFFESHLRDHERLRSGRSLEEYLWAVHPSPPAMSEACTANYFTANFFRP
jgi:hypothetical protein